MLVACQHIQKQKKDKNKSYDCPGITMSVKEALEISDEVDQRYQETGAHSKVEHFKQWLKDIRATGKFKPLCQK